MISCGSIPVETWGAFQDAAGVKDGEDFETDWFSDFVAQNTEFESWQAMLDESVNRWAVRQLQG